LSAKGFASFIFICTQKGEACIIPGMNKRKQAQYGRIGGRIGGKIGGKATGETKRRGDAEYYRALALKGAIKRRERKDAAIQ